MVVGESPGEGPRERVGEASLGEEEMSEEGRKVAEEDRKVAEGDHKVEVRPPEEEGMITQEGIQGNKIGMEVIKTCSQDKTLILRRLFLAIQPIGSRGFPKLMCHYHHTCQGGWSTIQDNIRFILECHQTIHHQMPQVYEHR